MGAGFADLGVPRSVLRIGLGVRAGRCPTRLGGAATAVGADAVSDVAVAVEAVAVATASEEALADGRGCALAPANALTRAAGDEVEAALSITLVSPSAAATSAGGRSANQAAPPATTIVNIAAAASSGRRRDAVAPWWQAEHRYERRWRGRGLVVVKAA